MQAGRCIDIDPKLPSKAKYGHELHKSDFKKYRKYFSIRTKGLWQSQWNTARTKKGKVGKVPNQIKHKKLWAKAAVTILTKLEKIPKGKKRTKKEAEHRCTGHDAVLGRLAVQMY